MTRNKKLYSRTHLVHLGVKSKIIKVQIKGVTENKDNGEECEDKRETDTHKLEFPCGGFVVLLTHCIY